MADAIHQSTPTFPQGDSAPSPVLSDAPAPQFRASGQPQGADQPTDSLMEASDGLQEGPHRVGEADRVVDVQDSAVADESLPLSFR